MTTPNDLRDRSEIPRDWWRVCARAFLEVVLIGVVCAFFDRFFLAAFALGLTVLVLIAFWRLCIRRRTSLRDAVRLGGAWVSGGLVGLLVVWYLFLMPDF